MVFDGTGPDVSALGVWLQGLKYIELLTNLIGISFGNNRKIAQERHDTLICFSRVGACNHAR